MSSSWWDVPAVEEFRVPATALIQLMDARGEYSAPMLLHAVHLQLPRLYLAGLLLPVKPETAFEDGPDEPVESPVASTRLEVHQSRWRPLFAAVRLQTPYNDFATH